MRLSTAKYPLHGWTVLFFLQSYQVASVERGLAYFRGNLAWTKVQVGKIFCRKWHWMTRLRLWQVNIPICVPSIKLRFLNKGGSRGIGLTLATSAASLGSHVAILDVQEPETSLETLKRQFHRNFTFHKYVSNHSQYSTHYVSIRTDTDQEWMWLHKIRWRALLMRLLEYSEELTTGEC